MFDRAEATEAAIVAASAEGHTAPAQRCRERRTMADATTAADAARTPAGGSLLLTLMKARTFIALIAVIVFFSLRRRTSCRPPT